jgi:hypothetical protein
MKRTTALVAALLAALASGCQVPPKAPDPATQTTTAKPAVDVWERSRQCAEQAEKVVKREQARLGPEESVLVWENHYSTKFERCYVRVTYLFRGPVVKAGIGPSQLDTLSDAFENRIVAEFAQGVKEDSSFCRIKDGSDDQSCRAAKAYIEERMTK